AAERIGADGLLLRIDESLAAKMLAGAQWYDQVGKRVSAVYVYRQTVRDYPRSAAAQLAINRLNELGESLADPDRAADVPPGDAEPGPAFEEGRNPRPPEEGDR